MTDTPPTAFTVILILLILLLILLLIPIRSTSIESAGN